MFLAGTSAHFCQLMSFSPIVITVIHHFSCVCWTLKHSSSFLLLLSKTWAMYISPQRIKFLCFCRFNLQVQATGTLLRQSAERAAFQNLFPCSELLRQSPFHYLWPWSVSLNSLSSFWPWLFSFQFIVSPPPPPRHFLSHATPRAQLFLLSLFSVNHF